MNKKICFNCGNPATTRDHIPPKNLFAKPRPSNLITVPACEACNGDTKLDDEYFRLMVASAHGVNKAASRVVFQRIIPRSKDRPALLKNFMDECRSIDMFSSGGIYVGEGNAYEPDRDRITPIINKVVKGLFYVETGERLDRAIVHDYVANPEFPEDFKNILCSLPLTDIGEGAFSYRYFMSEDDPRDSFWFLMFYDAVLFMVKTEPTSTIDK